ARGWKVTVFHRGRHEPPEGVEQVRGDRTVEGGLKALEEQVLEGRRWDVAVDTWSAAPTAVRDVTRLLHGAIERYVYISSRSVYRFPSPPGLAEEAEVV